MSTITNMLGYAKKLGFGNGCLATQDIADGMIPMPNRSPGSEWPELVFAGHPRSQLPRTEFHPDLSESSDHFVHGRTLRGISLNHVGHQWFHELKPLIFLGFNLSARHVTRRDESANQNVKFSNQVSEIVYISGKWITWRHPILVFRGRLVAPSQWSVKR